jgi:hypothetical protein
VGAVKDDCWGVVLGWAREERAVLGQTCLVVKEGVGKMEVSVEFVIVELHCHRVVRVLVHRPHESNQVQAQVLAVSAPRGGTRLERWVKLGLDKVPALAGALPEEVVVISGTLPSGIECVAGAIIINHKAVVVFSEIIVQ